MDANLAGIIGLIVVAMVIVAFFLAIAYKERELAADALRPIVVRAARNWRLETPLSI